MKEFEYIIFPRRRFSDELKQKIVFVKDVNNNTNLDAQVRSGDYFSLLATQLDTLSNKLPKTCAKEVDQIQDIIDDLLYIQSRYKLVVD